MKITLLPYQLKLKHTFTISRESRDVQDSLIVALSDSEYTGYGEATENPYYGITVEKMSEHIREAQTVIEECAGVEPELMWEKIEVLFCNDRFALCAVDMAYHDLYTKQRGVKLFDYWGLSTAHNPMTDYTIGIDTIPKMVAKLKEKPWPIYKIKLGTKEDIAIVTELRKHTDAVFRIDANCGWTVDETLKNAIALKTLGVEFLEQPLPADDWEGHRSVFKSSVLPIIADESCLVEEDVVKCYQHFHGINVKLTKCGGLTSAKRMLLNAKSLGMKTMVGCMTESTVGISAIAHLLPLLDYVDMDGALLLAEDIADGVTISEGVIKYSKLNGTGVSLR
ncbi:dipeptide epimerase [Flavobacteriaceae bacterium F08102]|nr:dipeptide epimerase [Flavobacteriaceae bacterium F08102]